MKNMSSAATMIFAAVSIVLGASSATANEGVVGVGDFSCATYVRLYDGGETDRRKLLLQRVEQWALGYMSGLNERADPGAVRDLSFFANADLGYDILSQCRGSADLSISEVVTGIYANALMASPGSA